MYSLEKLSDIIRNEFPQKKVMVIGDLMIDEYVSGSVKRISPEAPVPVLDYKKRDQKAGGASNVAHNVHALGGIVYLSGVAAEDKEGKWLRGYMEERGVDTQDIVSEEERETIVKTRLTTKGQQLLRIDKEETGCIREQTQERLIDALKRHIGDLDAVILSDYQKGVLGNDHFIEKIIETCNQNHILVTIDSKRSQINAFCNADFVKPNNLELEAAVALKITNDEELNRAGEIYLQRSGARCLVVTRGSEGISVFRHNHARLDCPAVPADVYDVTGAGDTVISTLTLGLSCGLPMEEALWLANTAAAVVISKAGTATVTGKELIHKLYEEQNSNRRAPD